LKISTKLFIAYLSFALIILIPIGLFLYVSAVNRVESQIQQSLDEKADHIFDKMDRVLFERYSDMLTLSNDPIFQGKVDLVTISKKLIAYRNQKKVYISLSYFDENCIKKVDTIGLGIGEECQKSEWTKDVYTNLRISGASDLFYDRDIKKKVIAFATPILNKNGEIKGAVTALISIGNLRQILNGTLQENESVLVDLVNQHFQLIDSNHLINSKTDFISINESEILKAPERFINSKTEEEGFLDFTGNGWVLYLQYPKSEAFLPITKLRNQVLGLGIGIITFSLFIILFLTNRTIQPLLKLKDAAHALGSGDLSSRVPVHSEDEIGQLSQSFNLMADELNQSLQTLESKNIELQKMDKLKDEFLSNTSHELKTPLNGIIGIAESLLDGAAGNLNQKINKNLNMITISGKRLANLVNDLLDFSKLKNQELIVQKKALDLRSLVNLVLLLSEHLLNGKKIQLENLIPEPSPVVLGDENRLQQIFLNLVGNAIKFTESGVISISSNILPSEMLQITITDTGIGIPQDKFETIFRSFEQVDASISREYGGTGLGLSISKNLIELHGGKIWLTSKVGIGSSFYFTLPLSNELPVTSKSETTVLNQIQPLPYEEQEDYIPINIGETKILIVDDEQINLQVLENHLSLAGYQVLQAHNGEEALAILKSDDIHLVLLDIMMPKMSGYDVCKIIRETKTHGSLPVILLTAKNIISDLVYGFECGANDYLTKPFQKEELLTRIKTHLEIANLNKSYARFVPNDYLKLLSKESITEVSLGDNVATEMTVVFSDIRSFTTLSETMTPQENFNFVNAYFKRISPKVREYGGIIVKYVGDAIMSVFKKDVESALDSVISQLNELKNYNEKRATKGYLPIRSGYGIHSGYMMVGMIGETNRMQGDAFSDNVNLAARLEGLTKYYGVSIIISATVLSSINNSKRYLTRYLDKVRVKGRKTPLEIYEVFNCDDAKTIEAKLSYKDSLFATIQTYLKGEFEISRVEFENYKTNFPDDKIIDLYLERIRKFESEGLPKDWDGIYDMLDK
jgi:two-component system sensor histidine kinase ChiS